MEASISTARERGRQAARGLDRTRTGVVLGLLMLAACVALDVLLDNESAAIVGTFVVAPFLTAFFAGPLATAGVGALAVAAAIASPSWNMNVGGAEQIARVGVIVLGTLFAGVGAWYRTRAVGRAGRMELLNSVGAIADGSLPLAETLARVTEVIVPAVADICMVDAVHDQRVSRLAVRARGRADADAVEEGIRHRDHSLPDWLVRGERSWQNIPRWWPKINDELVSRMSHSPEDRRFLASLELRSAITVPLRARDRNLGALTMITAWSKRRYGSDDVRFAETLGGRIALALDNAGLFSDLESIERRMDTVMSILDEAIVIHGSDGELVFANPAAVRSLGYETAEEATSTPTARIRDRFVIRDEEGNEVGAAALVGRRALTGQQTEAQTLRVTDRETGTERWTRTRAQVIEGQAGEVLYSVTAIEDVTDVKRAELSSRLLARTGELLSHSADYLRTLDDVAQLLVPEFADWCSVNMLDRDGVIEQVAVAHTDPERAARIRELGERYPIRVDDRGAIPTSVRSGEPLLVEITDEMLRSAAGGEAQLALLRELRMSSAIIAPMSLAGRTPGVLAFVNETGSRRFDSDDLALATEVANRAWVAIENARLADERARVADALQRELLPPRLPQMPGWEVATMYEPAGEVNEVGGDFYEVFATERGWAVVLGDVSGKGAAAAAVTAEARHTIRTAGALSNDPRRGLELLNANLHGREDAALCSVAVLVLPHAASEGSNVVLYLAGHPHPMLLREGAAEPVGHPGPLLGVTEDAHWEAVEVEVDPGDQLVLYTDGVIEARRPGGGRFGVERLQHGLAGSESPELVVRRVRRALAEFGAAARDDDAAVVAIRRRHAADGPPAARRHPRLASTPPG